MYKTISIEKHTIICQTIHLFYIIFFYFSEKISIKNRYEIIKLWFNKIVRNMYYAYASVHFVE